LISDLKKENLTIFVIDESKNEKRSFYFPRTLLVKHMPYFKSCLDEISNDDEIEISIHCDCATFETLLVYSLKLEGRIKEDDEEMMKRAEFNTGSIISVMISADFLKMETYVPRLY